MTLDDQERRENMGLMRAETRGVFMEEMEKMGGEEEEEDDEEDEDEERPQSAEYK